MKILFLSRCRVAVRVKFTYWAVCVTQYPPTPMYIKHSLFPSGPHTDPPLKLKIVGGQVVQNEVIEFSMAVFEM